MIQCWCNLKRPDQGNILHCYFFKFSFGNIMPEVTVEIVLARTSLNCSNCKTYLSFFFPDIFGIVRTFVFALMFLQRRTLRHPH